MGGAGGVRPGGRLRAKKLMETSRPDPGTFTGLPSRPWGVGLRGGGVVGGARTCQEKNEQAGSLEWGVWVESRKFSCLC